MAALPQCSYILRARNAIDRKHDYPKPLRRNSRRASVKRLCLVPAESPCVKKIKTTRRLRQLQQYHKGLSRLRQVRCHRAGYHGFISNVRYISGEAPYISSEGCHISFNNRIQQQNKASATVISSTNSVRNATYVSSTVTASGRPSICEIETAAGNNRSEPLQGMSVVGEGDQGAGYDAEYSGEQKKNRALNTS